MIDPKDGSIRIDNPSMTITRDMTREQFLQSPVAGFATPLNQNTPWSRYAFMPVIIGGESFAADICFNAGRLFSVGLAVMRPEFGLSWSDWSEEGEMARKRFHDSLLDSVLGGDWREQRFTWGSVYAEFDPRSSGSSIQVSYAT
jgi:hypothetical protein